MANPKLERWTDALDEMLSQQSPNKWSATWRGLTGLQQAALKPGLRGSARPPSADSVAWAAAQLGAKRGSRPASAAHWRRSAAKGMLERRTDGRGWTLIDPVQRAWLQAQCRGKP